MAVKEKKIQEIISAWKNSARKVTRTPKLNLTAGSVSLKTKRTLYICETIVKNMIPGCEV